MKIVFPMAGDGQRFRDAGYALPKPLIDVNGTPMIQHVVRHLGQMTGQKIFLVRSEYIAAVKAALGAWASRAKFIPVQEKTSGSACTVLLAADLIDIHEPLLIVDCDSITPYDQIQNAILHFRRRRATGGVTIRYVPQRPAHLSYAEVDEHWNVLRTAEKEPISDFSTTGPYWYAHGRDFVRAAKLMMINKDKTKGEFYVSPTYNYHLQLGGSVVAYPLTDFHHLGSPDELQAYLEHTHGRE